MTIAEDVNIISRFLAHDQVQLGSNPSSHEPYDCIVICVSAIFHCADTLFQALQHNPRLTKTLVLCGGIGHSTPHLYTAVANNPRYAHLASEIQGLLEAQVMQVIFNRCFDGKKLEATGLKVLAEDKSTNCGANAVETRKLLTREGVAMPRKVLVIQDPTMSLRTIKSFEKAFEDDNVGFKACPTFVPRVQLVNGDLKFDESGGLDEKDLWNMDRFLGLILGEVVRLRDDEDGYGPKGKGFIGHVDVPEAVSEAYGRLKKVVQANR